MSQHIPRDANFSGGALCREDLLRETTWIHELARRLVREGSTADELAQKAWVVALERSPTREWDRMGLRAWLAGLVRNLARHEPRAERRRALRQARAAKTEDVPSTHEVVERYALQRRVANAVLETREPYRSALLLHYFEGLSTEEVAARTDTNGATVRQRLSRGRALLRGQLDREHGTDCRAWLVQLLESAPQRVPWLRRRLVPLLAWAAAAGIVFLVALGLFQENGIQLAYATPAEPEGDGDRDEVVVASLELPPGALDPNDADDAAVLSDETGLPVTDVTRLEVKKPADELAALAELAGVEASQVRATEVFSVTTQNPRTGQSGPALAARVPLPELGPEVWLTLVVAEGLPIGLGLRGTPAFDDDPDGSWSIFLHQLVMVAGKVRIGVDSTPIEDVRAWLASYGDANGDEGDGPFLRAYLAQRTVMLANMQYVHGVRALEREDELPPPDWFTALADGMEQLALRSKDLAPVLGEEVGAHAERARAAAGLYADLERVSRDGDSASYLARKDEVGERCNSCHRAQLSEGTTKWFDAFDPAIEVFDLPRGALWLGYDLAPALGDPGTTSQRLANALRAGLYLLDDLRE